MSSVSGYSAKICQLYASGKYMVRDSTYACSKRSFRFPYCDTLKVLKAFGSRSCFFYPEGSSASIDEFERLLASRRAENPIAPPILALFTEFPSNPLLKSVDLKRLRGLADKYEFLIVVDDTIGNFSNVHVLPWADIIVSSLSKLFSGQANAMGGRYFFFMATVI
jgi:cystathionine gamma-synthase